MTFVEGVPPSKHFRCITQRYVLRSPISNQTFLRNKWRIGNFSPLPRRRGYARLIFLFRERNVILSMSAMQSLFEVEATDGQGVTVTEL